MTYTNEEIARAAGYTPENQPSDYDGMGDFWYRRRTVSVEMPDGKVVGGDTGDILYTGPDWYSDPGAVATHLLPVLEARTKDNIEFRRCTGEWAASSNEGPLSAGVTAPTLHAAVIEAVMQTREDITPLTSST